MWVLLLCSRLWAGPSPENLPAPPKQAVVVSVYDGDTVTLDSGDKVRVKLINTPEMRPLEAFAKEARQVTVDMTLNHRVELDYGDPPRDKYGRVVARIKVEGRDLAEVLLESGTAHLFIIPPDNAEMEPLLAAQKKAKDAGLGLWSHPRYQGAFHITSWHANADGNDIENVNGEYFRLCNITQEPQDLGGYVVARRDGRKFTLKTVEVPPGHTVKVHSGRGRPQLDSSSQLELYLGSSSPLWDNQSDELIIYDPEGTKVDWRVHEVQEKTP